MSLYRFFSLIGLCAMAALLSFDMAGTLRAPAWNVRAQEDEQSGRIDFTLQTGETVIAQVNDAPWIIAPTSARSAADFFFDLHIYSVPEESTNSLTLRDIPIDLEPRTYSIAPTRGPADLYVTAQFGAALVSPSGTFTVETIDLDANTFSATFTLTREDAVLSGTVTDLPLVPIRDCRTAGLNDEGGWFEFTVNGTELVGDAVVERGTGAWVITVEDNFITNAPLTYGITLQDTIDGEGLRLEFAMIPFDVPAGMLSAIGRYPEYFFAALNNRAAFQLMLIEDGRLELKTQDGRLSGTFDLLGRDRQLRIVLISGSFHNLLLPTRSCVVRNLSPAER